MTGPDGPGVSEEHEALIQFLYLAPVGLVQAALDGEIGMINPISAQLLMPLSRDGSLANLFTALESVAPSLRAMCAEFVPSHGVICDGLQLHLDRRGGRASGKTVISLTVVKLDQSRLMAVLSDVSLQVRRGQPYPIFYPPGATQPEHRIVRPTKTINNEASMQPDLPDSVDAYEALVQFLYRAPIGLVQISLDGTIEMLNPMSSSLLMPLAVNANLDNLFDVLATVAPQLAALASGFGAASGVICESLRIDLGDSAGAAAGPKCLSISLLKLDDNRLMAALADATVEMQREQETLARRLSSAARIDKLTQMPNRWAVMEQIALRLARPDAAARGEFAVLFMNFDRFKQINDTLGNAAGDQVLTMIAERMRGALRPPSDRIETKAGPGQMAARIGGDEFVVVLDGMRRPGDVDSVALRLLDAIGKPYHVAGHQISCNVSMGIVLGAEASGDADAVLRDASIAMAQAKRAGGARHVRFETSMRERAAQRGDIEVDLRIALRENQLFVVYQPVVGLAEGGRTDYSTGVEALVRWQHPKRGLVSPIEFIQVAEECGLIGALGDFVLTQACTDFVAWQAKLGATAPRLLAVNLSRAQLAQPGWTGTVAGILASTGMHAAQLQLEVTESLAAQDQQVQERLHELKALGIKLALDDFGTGYSSLASLHLLPVDTVKIDRSFVSQGDTSHHHRVLIEATVKVALSLGMDTVAEGIETDAQAAVVRELGCHKGQGYLFSKPLTTAALVQWLAKSGQAAA